MLTEDEELRARLIVTMQKIDRIPVKRWVFARNISNEHDFAYSSRIASRAYYKLWEILSVSGLRKSLGAPSMSCHVAEAPGSFVQAAKDMFGRQLRCLAVSRPPSTYRDVLVTSARNPIFSDRLRRGGGGADCVLKYADICDDDSRNDFIALGNDFSAGDGFELVTADGGVDEGKRYEQKEAIHQELIRAEVECITRLQKTGGSCVLKFFESFEDRTIAILWELCRNYESFTIVKPLTSRPTNSERYILCVGFLPGGGRSSVTFSDFSERVKRTNRQIVENQIRSIERTLSFEQTIRNVSIGKKTYMQAKVAAKERWKVMCEKSSSS